MKDENDYPRKVIILGSTGSIGRNTLEVCRNFPDLFKIAALSAHTREEELLSLGREFSVKTLALSGKANNRNFPGYCGPEGLLRMIRETSADIVINGISGAVGLLPSLTALESGKDLALANKETMVMAGELINALAKREGRRILPVDSEHSAVFFLLRNRNPKELDSIILTASGGALRDLPLEDFFTATLEQVLRHPNWSMGRKITVDSATMANKGLEVLEAEKLFGLPAERIQVVIHPQSRVHSFIRTVDGALYAQLSDPDMRLPIMNALTFPDLPASPFGKLDFSDLTLNFYKPDTKKYPLLPLAYSAAASGGGYPLAYNAANEVAVEAFMQQRIGFMDIASIVSETLEGDWQFPLKSIDTALEMDRIVREYARRVMNKKVV